MGETDLLAVERVVGVVAALGVIKALDDQVREALLWRHGQAIG